MYAEDRVLVAYVPHPADFEFIRKANWYRIPQRYAPKGLYAEYIAFYFGRRFGAEKWAVHYYARNLGHELFKRIDLLPDEPDHPRAQDIYYRIQLGQLIRRKEPIMSLRWRRITFLHTTWDRFQDAAEINDLFVEGGEYVDRLYATLKDEGIQAERNYQVREPDAAYIVPLSVPCRNGRIDIHPHQIPQSEAEVTALTHKIKLEVSAKGGATHEPAVI